jgi:hypothetical protein
VIIRSLSLAIPAKLVYVYSTFVDSPSIELLASRLLSFDQYEYSTFLGSPSIELVAKRLLSIDQRRGVYFLTWFLRVTTYSAFSGIVATTGTGIYHIVSYPGYHNFNRYAISRNIIISRTTDFDQDNTDD